MSRVNSHGFFFYKVKNILQLLLYILSVINLDFLLKIIYYISKYAKTCKEVIKIEKKNKIDKVVWKEVSFIAIWMLIFSGIMEAVFLVIGKWDYTVLLGNLLSGIMGVVNFLLLGMTVQKAVSSDDVKYAKNLMKTSQSLRLLMMGVVIGIGAIFDCFNIWATIIPVFFPRIAMVIRSIILNKQGGKEENESGNDEHTENE